MLNKKGVSAIVVFIVSSVIILIFGWSILNFIMPGLGDTMAAVDRTTTEQFLDRCLALKDIEVTGHNKNICYNCDYDGDGLKDFCDNCPRVNNYGATTKDEDNDLFPDTCCGNDGQLKWKKNTKGDWEPKSLDQNSLPCNRYTFSGFKKASIKEVDKNAKNPGKYPVYKNIPFPSTWGQLA